jgi:hypothetical protein
MQGQEIVKIETCEKHQGQRTEKKNLNLPIKAK